MSDEEVYEDEEEAKPIPLLFDHCCRVYAELCVTARKEVEDGPLVWEGHLTKLFAQLGLPIPYYTTVMRKLKGMGCAEQLRRGGGGSASKWQLNFEPTEELFLGTRVLQTAKSGKLATAEQQIRDLNKRVSALERLLL